MDDNFSFARCTVIDYPDSQGSLPFEKRIEKISNEININNPFIVSNNDIITN